jgi:hypothetical protein
VVRKVTAWFRQQRKEFYTAGSQGPKLLIFSVRGTACTRGSYNPLCRLMSRPLQHSPGLSQPYCVLHTAPGSARGGHFSNGLVGYNIGNVQ